MSSEDQFTSVQWDRPETTWQSDPAAPADSHTSKRRPKSPETAQSSPPKTPPTEQESHTLSEDGSSRHNGGDFHEEQAETPGDIGPSEGRSGPVSKGAPKSPNTTPSQQFPQVAPDQERQQPQHNSGESPSGGTFSAGEPAQPEAVVDGEGEASEGAKIHEQLPSEQEQELQQIEGFRRMAQNFQQFQISSHVSDPLSDRDSSSKAFISYLVVTKTNHPEVLKLQPRSDGTLKVRRRYGDFRFLHDCLMADFPQLLVPPLPAKSNFKYLTGDTFSTPFVHKRLHSLDRFISYICQHQLLSQSSVFHYFISDSAEWGTFTQNLKILKDEDSESSLVGKVVNEELLTETVMNFFTSSKHKRETNKDILEISDKLKRLYENLIKLDRIFSRLNKKNGDLKGDYEAFSQQINKLAALHEASDAAGVSGVTANFRLFSESLVYFSDSWAQLYKHVDESFLVTLKDCSKYIIRLTNLIELQHNKKIDLQVLQDYLNKARADLAGLSGNPQSYSPPNPALIGQYSGGIVNNTAQLIKDTISVSATPHIGSSQAESKKWKLQNRIRQLESEICAQTSLVNDLTSRIINEEYPNWDHFNTKQLKKAMSDLCDQKILFYRNMMDNWTDVEQKLMKRLEELE